MSAAASRLSSLRALRHAASLASRARVCSSASCASRPTLVSRRLSSASPRPPAPASAAASTSPSAAAGATGAGAASAATPRAATSRSAALSETLSKYLWRLLLVGTGAAAAGCGAVYATDPAGAREMARAAKEDMEERVRFFTEPSREELLPDAVPPFPGAPPLRTLVIELDALVHSSYNRQLGWRVAKRPGADAFLAYMAGFYEIVVFTSGMNSYADPILNRLDENRLYIAYRLYRAETKYEGGVHRKDLSHLNRDLSRVVLVDDDPEHFSRQPENAILVPSWSDDSTDTALLDLIPFLEGLVQEDAPDVRTEIEVLKGRPLSDGLAEWKALAGTRGRAAAGRGSLFGTQAGAAVAAVPSSAAPGAGEEADGGKEGGGSWLGSVSPKSLALFRPAPEAKASPAGAEGKED